MVAELRTYKLDDNNWMVVDIGMETAAPMLERGEAFYVQATWTLGHQDGPPFVSTWKEAAERLRNSYANRVADLAAIQILTDLMAARR